MNALPAAAAFVLTVLANGLWQAALLALAAWFVLRIARGANATTRHAVLVAALIGGIVLPIATASTALVHPASALALSTAAAPQHRTAPAPSLRTTHPAAQQAPAHIRHTEPVAMRPLGTAAPRLPAAVRPLFTLPRALILTLVGLWLAGMLVLLARLAFSLLYLERLKHDALPLPVEYRSRLERWAAAGKGARDVRLCRSSEITVPIAVGIFDAMILVPERLLEDLPSEDVDRILLHELAHLRRGDDWINALERIAEALLFFNPGIRWIVRQLDVEREVACDDWVLERRSEALPYAQCLVKLVENVTWPYRPMTAPGVFVTRRSISIRIERLLAKGRDVRLRISPGPLGALTVLAATACVFGAYFSPSFAASAVATVPSKPPKPLAAAAVPVSPAHHKLRVSAQAQPSAPPSSEPTPAPLATFVPTASPAPLPTSFRVHIEPVLNVTHTVKPVQHAVVAESNPNSRVVYKLNMLKTTRSNVLQSNGTAADVRRQVAALSDAESATPSPAITGEDFIGEMAAAGYTNLSVDDLIKLKSLGVNGAYVREMRAAGLGRPSVNELAQMRSVGVTPQFAGDMHRTFPSVSIEDIISMRAVGVTSSYVADLRAAGVRELTADSVRSMRALGVEPAFVRQLAAAGYPNLPAEQLEQLRAIGVDGMFLKKVQEHNLHLSVDELIKLKTSGVLFQ